MCCAFVFVCVCVHVGVFQDVFCPSCVLPRGVARPLLALSKHPSHTRTPYLSPQKNKHTHTHAPPHTRHISVSEVLLVDAPWAFRPLWEGIKPLLRKYSQLVRFADRRDAAALFAPGDAPPEFCD